MSPLSIFITVDTEFSVGDAFDSPRTGQPVGPDLVYCEVDGRSEGLGFLLDTLVRHDLRSTFFVEALHTVWFGDEPMGEVARQLVAAGQDVQLHAHPFWLYFRDMDWRDRIATDPPNDQTSGKLPEAIASLVRQGQETFERWGIPPATAYRTGGLDVDENVYRALAMCDLHVASNIGLAIYEPADPSLHHVGGAHRIHDVVELPVLTYRSAGLRGNMSRKSLTITGCSWSEIRSLLWKARAAGYQHVVLLTHPFEFSKRDARGNFRVNRINQDRFRRLCEFVSNNPGDFQASVMRDVDPLRCDSVPVPMLEVSFWQAASRILINRVNDYI